MLSSFLGETFVDSGGFSLPYRMLIPPGYSEQSRNLDQLPLVVVLHGSGESGTDNLAQLGNGVAELLVACPPCFSVVPQCPTDRRWVEVDWGAHRHVLPPEPSLPLSATLKLLDWLFARYPIDPARIYLIGLSMGGFGVWDLLSRLPECFAAAAPICGGADERALTAARSVPVWAFHGTLDDTVPVERSRQAIAALRAVGGTPRYTEYPEVEHDAWTAAFAETVLLPWLFSQRREAP